MQDHKLYQQILGIEQPWYVQGVTLDREAEEIEIRVGCEQQHWACPECHQRMHRHDCVQRRWRHLDSCQFKTFIKADVPVVKCPEHGVQHVRVPWAEPYARFSRLFERLGIDLMRECSISAACKILRITWEEADGIKQRAVKRGMARRQAEPLPFINVDEKNVGRGQDCLTVVSKITPGKSAIVWHLSEKRRKSSMNEFWESLTPEQIDSVQCVSMDMHEPYRLSTMTYLPQAEEKITHDPFHIAKHMNEAVDALRKQEHKELLKRNDPLLTGTKWCWLKGLENLTGKAAEKFHVLKNSTLKTARAWSLKEMLRDFWRCSQQDAPAFLNSWYSWAIRSRLEPVKKVARMIKRHLQGILNFFKHGLSNASAEGLNNRIQGLVNKAYGYRNRDRLKIDIMFHLGGLDLYPGQ